VLKEFLLGLNHHTRWVMKLPGVFSDLVDMGRRLSQRRIAYGTSFFSLFGQGEFGERPRQVRMLMRWMRRLEVRDPELALAFLRHHRALIDRLLPQEVDLYINEGLKLYERNPQSGVRFMDGTLKASETIVQTLSQECRLADVRAELSHLLRALTGREVEVSDLGGLDSDELIERGSKVVCLHKWLYVPSRIRTFPRQATNRTFYLLQAVVAAGMLHLRSFPLIHGHPSYPSLQALVGPDLARMNLLQVAEFTRVLRGMARMWPGAAGLLRFGLEREQDALPPTLPADALVFECAGPDEGGSGIVAQLRDLTARSDNVFGTLDLIDGSLVQRAVEQYPGLDRYQLRAFSFLPDFRFTVELSAPPSDMLVADLKSARHGPRDGDSEDGSARARRTPKSAGGRKKPDKKDDKQEQTVSEACYLYDEWSEPEGDYYADYCRVHEMVPDAPEQAPPIHAAESDVARVRRVFERLKPDVPFREKHLEDGDYIDTDMLVTYLVERHHEPSPRVMFYQRPRILRRDVALLILLDVSGSTGENTGRHQRFIDVQKRAAFILGEGLDSLGDRFSICGFSGNGRENCEYFVYKTFDEPWDETCRRRVTAAAPRSSTRIGAALRHSGYRLEQIETRKRLIVLISDGRPMDSGYDPNTRYAQYDVRMAYIENRRRDIHTFCISTNENTVADMQIMFPDANFAILPHIRRLPKVLPQLYLRLTT
jgi:nitric oxide reductase activation protein